MGQNPGSASRDRSAFGAPFRRPKNILNPIGASTFSALMRPLLAAAGMRPLRRKHWKLPFFVISSKTCFFVAKSSDDKKAGPGLAPGCSSEAHFSHHGNNSVSSVLRFHVLSLAFVEMS